MVRRGRGSLDHLLSRDPSGRPPAKQPCTRATTVFAANSLQGSPAQPITLGEGTPDLGFAMSRTYHVGTWARFNDFCFLLKEAGLSLVLKATIIELPAWFGGVGVGAGGRTPGGNLVSFTPGMGQLCRDFLV